MCSEIVLLLVVCIAAVTDIRTGRIRNWLTLPAIAGTPLIHLLQTGAHGAILSLEGIGVMVLISALFVSLNLFGGGDIKLQVVSPLYWSRAERSAGPFRGCNEESKGKEVNDMLKRFKGVLRDE